MAFAFCGRGGEGGGDACGCAAGYGVRGGNGGHCWHGGLRWVEILVRVVGVRRKREGKERVNDTQYGLGVERKANN